MSDTPKTDMARKVYAEWVEYMQMYGYFPDSLEADPFAFAETMETELAALRAENAELRRDVQRYRKARDDYKNFAILQNIGHDWTRLEPHECDAALEGTKDRK